MTIFPVRLWRISKEILNLFEFKELWWKMTFPHWFWLDWLIRMPRPARLWFWWSAKTSSIYCFQRKLCILRAIEVATWCALCTVLLITHCCKDILLIATYIFTFSPNCLIDKPTLRSLTKVLKSEISKTILRVAQISK